MNYLKMLDSVKIKEYLLVQGVDIVGFHLLNGNHDEYYNHLNQKKINNNLYPRKVNTNDYANYNKVVKNAKTLISIGICYNNQINKNNNKNIGYYSKISHGIDYHVIVNEKLLLLKKYILQSNGNAKIYTCCDTGILDDRYISYLCGNGFYGKNSMIINEEFGPSVVYGSLVCDIEINNISNHQVISKCLDCNLCEKACPTNSLANYQLSYHTCLSYLTQTSKMIDLDLLQDSFYGCDICNDVCIYQNNNINHQCFNDIGYFDLLKLIKMNKQEYQNCFSKKSLSWLNFNIIKKNALLLYVKNNNLNKDELLNLKQELSNAHLLNSKILQDTFNYLLERND
ncbi:MAG: DUF1730 domain-containing protein [Bacilli bacterium]|nr:DUF1730 domain-containing protein [Bacilli bacterium]